MKRRFRCPVQAKKEFVTEVLSGMRTEVVARKYGMAPKTLRAWVRQYQDEEMEEKYKGALKLLGEKELELHILRDLVKKKYPDWK
jgi:transposase-like protein